MTADPKRCAGSCGLRLAGRTHYREVVHCWVERRQQGGANAPRLAIYTGRAVCALCLAEALGPGEDQAAPKVRECDRCDGREGPLFLEVVHCWVAVRGKGANSITRPVYSGLVLCRRCLFEAEQGEQMQMEL